MSVVLFHHFVSTILVKYVILVFASPPLAWKLRKVLDIAWSFSVKIFQALIWFSSHLVNAWKFKFPLWRKEIYSRFTLYCDSELVQQSQNLSTAVNDIANWPKSDSNSKLFMSSKYFFLSINKWHMVPSFQNIFSCFIEAACHQWKAVAKELIFNYARGEMWRKNVGGGESGTYERDIRAVALTLFSRDKYFSRWQPRVGGSKAGARHKWHAETKTDQS